MIKRKPTAGDVIVCTRGEMLGRFGFLVGTRGERCSSWRVSFDSRPFFDGESISCSGGIAFDVKDSELLSTGKLTAARYEKCREGYNGFPTGEIHQEDVVVWEYRDKTPKAFYSDVISLDEIEKRRSAEYEFTEQAAMSKMLKFSMETDSVGRAIFSTAKSFDLISFHVRNGDYVLSVGLNEICLCKGKRSFQQLLSAYSLGVAYDDENRGVVIPNINVADWAPKGYRRLIS